MIRQARDSSADLSGWLIWPVTGAVSTRAVQEDAEAAFTDAMTLLAEPPSRLTSASSPPHPAAKFLKKYAAYTPLVIDEWRLDHPNESMRSMLLELLERRYDAASRVFCTQYAKKDWHQRLGSGVHANAIMDRIVHNTIWADTGNHNMRKHALMNQ